MAAHFPLDLPDKDADRKRLRQKDLLGKGFDNMFGDEETQYFSPRNARTLDARALGNTSCSAFHNREDRPAESHQIRRSIQTHMRTLPLHDAG